MGKKLSHTPTSGADPQRAQLSSYEPPFFWTQDMNPEPSVSQLSSYCHLPVQAPTELHTKLHATLDNFNAHLN